MGKMLNVEEILFLSKCTKEDMIKLLLNKRVKFNEYDEDQISFYSKWFASKFKWLFVRNFDEEHVNALGLTRKKSNIKRFGVKKCFMQTDSLLRDSLKEPLSSYGHIDEYTRLDKWTLGEFVILHATSNLSQINEVVSFQVTNKASQFEL